LADPVVFEEANTDLRGGSTGAMDIRVWMSFDRTRTIACVAFTPDEMAEVNRTGRCWISVAGGWPPLSIMGRNPFVRGDEASHLMVLEDKARSLSRIDARLAELPESFFEGDNSVAKLMRDLRDEASHAR
jgi:hypothetical protein